MGTRYNQTYLENVAKDFSIYLLGVIEEEVLDKLKEEGEEISQDIKEKIVRDVLLSEPILVSYFNQMGDDYVDFFELTKDLQAALCVVTMFQREGLVPLILEKISSSWREFTQSRGIILKEIETPQNIRKKKRGK